MSNEKLKDRISQPVEFDHYRDGSLWYRAHDGFVFPVPISDIGTAKFLARDKGLLFMRYIRKYMDMIADERDRSCSFTGCKTRKEDVRIINTSPSERIAVCAPCRKEKLHLV